MTIKSNKVKEILTAFVGVFLVIILFAGIDYLIHKLNETEWGVPGYYFTNKIIYGTIWGLVAYVVLKKLKTKTKSLIFSAFVSIVLQIRYAYEGYPINFILLFLIMHFLILLPVTYLTFKLMKI